MNFIDRSSRVREAKVRVGSRAVNAITAELLEQVKVLDGITRYRFGMSPEMMAEWNAVRRVPGRTRPVDDGVVSPNSGGVAPAA